MAMTLSGLGQNAQPRSLSNRLMAQKLRWKSGPPNSNKEASTAVQILNSDFGAGIGIAQTTAYTLIRAVCGEGYIYSRDKLSRNRFPIP